MRVGQPDILQPVLIVSFGFLLLIVGLFGRLGMVSVVLIGPGMIPIP